MHAPVEPRALLRGMFDAAVASAQPALCVPPHLPAPPRGRLVVCAATLPARRVSANAHC